MKVKIKNSVVIFYAVMFCSLNVFAQSFPYTVAPDFDQTNNIRCYLSKVAGNITQNSLKDIHNLKEWEAVREHRREQFLEMMGLQGKPFTGTRSPLHVTKTGVIQQDGYRIEKLYYESLPGLYVPANLYIPDGIKKPVPAILYVCGHAHTQKHYYQAHARNFAQNGFVCLIIETIQRGEVKGEHLGEESNGWFQWYSRGYNPGGVEIWNGIRGLDLLCEMKEVDKNNLGVTGISGGGSQSWYLPAVDARIKAAAAVAGAGSLEGQIAQRTIDDHCDCMMPINTYGIDFSDIGALIAPRPFMIAQPSRDLYYSIEAVHTLYDHVKPIYAYYGKPGNIKMVDATGGHSYGSKEELRPQVLSFFIKELMGKTVAPEAIGAIDITMKLSDEELKAYVHGAPANDLTKVIQDSFVKLAEPPVIQNVEQFDAYKKEVVAFLTEKTFGAFPKQAAPLDIRLEFQSTNGAGNGRQEYSFVSEEGWRLKIELQNGPPETGKQPLLLVLKNPGEERWDSYGLTSGIKEKTIIAYFEARGIGETGWSPSLQWHIRRASAWTGRTIASMRVYDVLRCLEVLRKMPGVHADNISVLAQGEMAAVAPYAALLDGNVKSLLIKNPPTTQNAASEPNGRGEAIEMLNCLRITDLPQVAGLMFPKKLFVIGELPSSYKWTENLYKNLDNPDAFRIIQKPSEWSGN
ncbi:MAG TPA: alpha/beta hydrolase family protein [Agriterribacter sp.]|nr:alpha/beta hydrolase family protein [Agriterribacter sp.]